jgi:hypothetical protein
VIRSTKVCTGQRISPCIGAAPSRTRSRPIDQLRHQLADELGVDPSPPLQRLHQQVLAHDPALAWTPPSTPQAEAARQNRSRHDQLPSRRRAVDGPWLRTRWLVGRRRPRGRGRGRHVTASCSP